MLASQRSRSRGRASQRSAEAGDIQPQASKAPSGDGELQAGPPPSSRAAKPTGSRPRWRQGTLPEAPGAAPEDGPHKHEDTQEPEDNQRESRQQAYRGPWRRPGPTSEEWIEARGQTFEEIVGCFFGKPEETQEPEENQRESSKDKDKEGTTQPEPQREDKKGATQPEREDTEQEPQTEREDKDTQEKPEAPEEAPEDPEDPEDPEEEPETQPEDPEEVVPDSQPPWEDAAEQRAWQRSARRASASLQSRWELDSQL